jgi:hypothetical protein
MEVCIPKEFIMHDNFPVRLTVVGGKYRLTMDVITWLQMLKLLGSLIDMYVPKFHNFHTCISRQFQDSTLNSHSTVPTSEIR